jgi:hypothetical protein
MGRGSSNRRRSAMLDVTVKTIDEIEGLHGLARR